MRLLVFGVLLYLHSSQAVPFQGYTFYRDAATPITGLKTEGNTLMLNGKPLRILSGTIHYFRVMPEYWYDRLLKLKAAGLNTVETYVPWNLHQPQPAADLDFTGMLNIKEFVETAKKLDLLVILRPGPYICAEWELGGLPSWLLTTTDMKVRTKTEPYMNATKDFLGKLVSQIVDLQFTKDGPIFLVQVENEYGAYGNDVEFLDASAQQLKDAGIVETLVTSDGPNDLAAGKASNVWMTVNEKNDMGRNLEKLAELQKDKPLMVMEYWAGWFDHWTEQHNTISTEKFALELRAILNKNASVNFYVFHGGTSFGFLNGANFALTNKELPYEPDITSYDYDAPVGEFGEIREKWHKMREIFKEFGLLADNLPTPPDGPLPVAYGEKNIQKWLSLKDLSRLVNFISSPDPMHMEKLEIIPGSIAKPGEEIVYTPSGATQSYGFVSYEIDIKNDNCDLTLPELHDRAVVLIDNKEVHVIEYSHSTKKTHTISVKKSGDAATLNLKVIVENMGRANYARKDTPDNNTMNLQLKGMNGAVLFCDNKNVNDGGKNWAIHPLQLSRKDMEKVSSDSWKTFWKNDTNGITYPSLMLTNFEISDDPKDTFMDLTGWGRGAVFVNGFNIGRYWPDKGPQLTLYIPAPLLKKGLNTVLIFELHKSTPSVRFQDKHRITNSTCSKPSFHISLILFIASCLAVFHFLF